MKKEMEVHVELKITQPDEADERRWVQKGDFMQSRSYINLDIPTFAKLITRLVEEATATGMQRGAQIVLQEMEQEQAEPKKDSDIFLGAASDD